MDWFFYSDFLIFMTAQSIYPFTLGPTLVAEVN